MFSRQFFITLTAAIVFLFSSVAQADNYRSEYKKCLKTDLVDFHGTIADAAIANPFNNLGTLLTAVVNADPAVLAAISDPHARLTVLAPTDDAFAKVPNLGDILPDTPLLTNILLYHVLDGVGRRYDPRRTFWGWALEKKTLLGQTVFFNRSRTSPQVNQSNVNCQGVKTDNGVIWIIDSVLLPQFTH